MERQAKEWARLQKESVALLAAAVRVVGGPPAGMEEASRLMEALKGALAGFERVILGMQKHLDDLGQSDGGTTAEAAVYAEARLASYRFELQLKERVLEALRGALAASTAERDGEARMGLRAEHELACLQEGWAAQPFISCVPKR